MLRSQEGTRRRLGLLGLLMVVSGCASSAPAPLEDGIGYRQARFEQVRQIREYRACRDHGIELDARAREVGDPARYLAAARMLEGCEADLGSAARTLAVEERMRAFGLAVQARLKGGDLLGARGTLERFEEGFPGRDLYFEDGTSFLDTVQALLVAGGDAGRVAPATANIPVDLKDELRRVGEWRRK